MQITNGTARSHAQDLGRMTRSFYNSLASVIPYLANRGNFEIKRMAVPSNMILLVSPMQLLAVLLTKRLEKITGKENLVATIDFTYSTTTGFLSVCRNKNQARHSRSPRIASLHSGDS